MDFGIMFFSSAAGEGGRQQYELLLDAARLADERGFCAVWTPERHFHRFGGLFPNPSLLSAALAMITSRVQLRAGSLVSPLHHELRIAEEWSVVDNLSGGRAAVSFGSGWHVDDFLFFPQRYERRQAVMYEQIATVRRLWRGETLQLENSYGKPVRISLYPRPVQPELPIWVTSSGNVETFASAGRHGANVLTHLLGQDTATLAGKIDVYRAALAEHHGARAAGKVSLMLHTFVGEDLARVREQVRGPFREYLRSALSLEQLAAAAGGSISGGHRVAAHEISPAALEELLDISFERYFRDASLMGTAASCESLLLRLEEIGVDEVACLIDFIADREAVLEGLECLDSLRAAFQPGLSVAGERSLGAFLQDLE
jgi:natural product biosynthesis luciferase-like monooxygenase protein